MNREAKNGFDLEARLLEYAAEIIRAVERLPNTRAGNHIASQLLRSGTAALPNHGEAQEAESRNDFIHKLKISLKELRESQRWLLLIRRVPLLPEDQVDALLTETDQLIRIFRASVQTAQRNRLPSSTTAPSSRSPDPSPSVAVELDDGIL